MYFRQIEDSMLAQYAYLVGCQRTGEAIVIDPERDIDRYVDLAESEGLRIVAASETHIHADFLSGVREMGEQLGARLYLSGEGGPDWQSFWAKGGDYDVQFLKDGDSFRVGNILLKAVHTPGHTPEHMSFLITDQGGGADEPMGIATGDFVFVGDLGRPDLLESAAGQEGMMEPSARTLYRSAVGVLDLPDYLQVWPGHGAGSACGKALGAVPGTTLGYERRFSPAFAAAEAGEDEFVRFILEGQPEPPVYFARMKDLNREGVPLLGPVPRPARRAAGDLSEVATAEGTVVLDMRQDRTAFFQGHVPGSIYSPLNKSFHSYVGSYVDPASALFLIVDADRVDDAVRSLVRIGYDRIEGFFTPDAVETYAEGGGPMASIPVMEFQGVVDRLGAPGATVLDVRKATEYEEGHVTGAVNVAHTRLLPRLEELPRDRTLLVHCKSGARAAAAVSFLRREGFDVVVVNDAVEAWRDVAVPVS